MATKPKNSKGGLVYSTGTLPPREEEEEVRLKPSEQNLRVWLERRGGGKLLSIVKGYQGSGIEELENQLKKFCGVGGSSKDQEILIQGDQREKILKKLGELGFPARKAGG